MTSYKLRDYQARAVQAGIELLSGPKKNGVIVLPTGAGKSLVIANIADQAGGDTLVLQPSKEILEQNYQKLINIGRKDVSIFSASLGIKRISRITLATIGSIYKDPESFKHFERILIDECDLVNAKEGMYKSFFEAVGKPVLGFTASPWRMYPGHKIGTKRVRGGREIDVYSGSINKIITRTRPRVFDSIIHITQIAELYDQGYLCSLDYRQHEIPAELFALNTTGADYTDATYTRISANVRRDAVWAVQRTKAKSHLIFTKLIEDAEAISRELDALGISCAVVTGTTPPGERESILSQFKSHKIDAVANVGVLTVGFDHPALDHIILARPTNSARLYYQMLGRGIRIHPDKEKCTLTDLCGNIARFGKIEDWIIKPDEHGLIRLFSDDKPLSGVDLKSGDDLEVKRDQSVIHFGKYKGQAMADVPKSYLQWIIENFSAGPFRNQATDELARRASSSM